MSSFDDNHNVIINTNASFDKDSPQSNYSSCSSNSSQISFNNFSISKLIYSISQTLHNIINQNKTNNEQRLSRFHSTEIPEISIYDYLIRIKTYSQLEDNTLIMSLILIDRFVQKSNIPLSYYNLHRILFTAVLISIKYHEDCIFDNNYYAEIAGVSMKELFYLESDFLCLLDFKLYIDSYLFDQYNVYLNNIITKYQYHYTNNTNIYLHE